MFDSSKDAKAAGNFSRRHRTSEAHEKARAQYLDRRAARKENALDRQKNGSMLTHEERQSRGRCEKATSMSSARGLLKEVFGEDGNALAEPSK